MLHRTVDNISLLSHHKAALCCIKQEKICFVSALTAELFGQGDTFLFRQVLIQSSRRKIDNQLDCLFFGLSTSFSFFYFWSEHKVKSECRKLHKNLFCNPRSFCTHELQPQTSRFVQLSEDRLLRSSRVKRKFF